MCFFFNDTATTEIYTLSLHDALPIWNSIRIPVWRFFRTEWITDVLPRQMVPRSVKSIGLETDR